MSFVKIWVHLVFATKNREPILKKEFRYNLWQDDYFAVSVSESQVETVTNYIKNQETHHTKKSFDEEVNVFMNEYGWQLS